MSDKDQPPSAECLRQQAILEGDDSLQRDAHEALRCAQHLLRHRRLQRGAASWASPTAKPPPGPAPVGVRALLRLDAARGAPAPSDHEFSRRSLEGHPGGA